MKSYTNIEQSKKLADILPLESADMVYFYWINSRTKEEGIDVIPTIRGELPIQNCDIPCWSLAALLDVLQIYTTPTAFSTNISVPSLTKTKNGYSITYVGDYRIMESNNKDTESPIEFVADKSVDACVEMILKLHKIKML